MRVLVLEDDPRLARTMTKYLEWMHGCDVTCTHTVQDAVQALQEGSYERVVSDVCLRGETGVDLYRWLLEHQPDLVERMAFHTGGFPGNLGVEDTGVPIFVKGKLDDLAEWLGGSDR